MVCKDDFVQVNTSYIRMLNRTEHLISVSYMSSKIPSSSYDNSESLSGSDSLSELQNVLEQDNSPNRDFSGKTICRS